MRDAGDQPTANEAGGSAPVRAVFFGSGSFAVPILEALAAIRGVRTVAVVSAPDRPVGRKAIVTPTPVTARARELGLPVVQPFRVRRPEAIEEISALAPDLIVLADYGQLIPRSLLDLPPRGFLNLHPSALPRWRGAAPIPATILEGDPESAVTLMVVTEEMDAGPIVATAPLEVRPGDTSVTLEERASEVAARLLTDALPDWIAGRLQAVDQPAEGVTFTRPLRREDGILESEDDRGAARSPGSCLPAVARKLPRNAARPADRLVGGTVRVRVGRHAGIDPPRWHGAGARHESGKASTERSPARGKAPRERLGAAARLSGAGRAVRILIRDRRPARAHAVMR